MRLFGTQIAPPHLRTSLSSLTGSFEVVTAGAAAARSKRLAPHALLVVASWCDDDGCDRTGCWLRAAPPSGGPIALAVGAHLEADVGLVVGASLRHAVLLLDPEVRPGMIEVIDLHTQEGLRHEGDEGVRRLLAAGAVRFGAGTADLLAVALAPGERVEDARQRAIEHGALEAFPTPRHAVPWRGGHARIDRGASIAFPMDLSPRDDVVRREAVTQIEVDCVAGADDAGRVVVPAAELAEGVLLGRYPRCLAGGDSLRVSRVHALVRARGQGLLVVDVGSTNGTTVRDCGKTFTLRRGRRAVAVSNEAVIGLSALSLRVLTQCA